MGVSSLVTVAATSPNETKAVLMDGWWWEVKEGEDIDEGFQGEHLDINDTFSFQTVKMYSWGGGGILLNGPCEVS